MICSHAYNITCTYAYTRTHVSSSNTREHANTVTRMRILEYYLSVNVTQDCTISHHYKLLMLVIRLGYYVYSYFQI